MTKSNKQPRSRRLGWTLVALGLLVLLLLPSIAYVVDQTEQAVVLQFGKPVAERTAPGIYFKLPIMHEVQKMPSTKQFWGDRAHYALPDLPTKDDKKIELIPWAIWRINQPTTFVQRLRTIENAEERVAQFARGAIRDIVTKYDLAEIVRSSDRALYTTAGNIVDNSGAEGDVPAQSARQVRMDITHGRPKILREIEAACAAKLAASESGIELVDVGISQIEFVESVRIKTFDRWIAERQAISARNINEGKKAKQEIINLANADVQRILGEGQQQANETRGRIDAEVITKYAAAMNEVGEFYNFVRTLEAYEKALGKDTRLILTTDSDFLRLLKAPPETAP